jgi:AcrR family transcriptional regulator
MSPRPYRLGRREAAVEDTRTRILASARDVLGEHGFAGFTIDAVADRAGVARMTVYYQFDSKGALLDALLDALAAGSLVDRLHASLGRADPVTRIDPLDVLDEFIAAFVGFWASDRVVIRRLRSLAGLDPEVEGAVSARDAKRRAGLRVLVIQLIDTLGHPVDASIEDVTDLLHTLTSFETFDALAGRSRSPEDVAALLIRVAHAALVADAPVSA